jgi:hypothetical protein
MSPRTATRLAWAIGALCLTGALAGLVLTALDGTFEWRFGRFAAALTPLVAFPVVGALIAARQPRNPVGWQLLAVGALFMLDGTTGAYARYALAVAPGSLPGGLVLAWVGALAFAPIVWVLLILLPLYFPTGRLLSSRWRLVAWAGGLFTALAIVGNALRPDIAEIAGIGTVRNPFAIPSAIDVLDRLLTLALPFLIVGIGGAMAAIVVRFRRARGVERAQLKWFTYAASLTPLPFIAHDLAPPLADPLFAVILPLVPVSIGIAILRYRLYDIDRVINRTLVYALLTALLGVVYVVGVFGLGQLLNPVTGESALAVAASTLAVAALFQPARRRIQTVVDRRFNRRKYNAARTVEAFSLRLRDQVELDRLAAELVSIVDQTMQPTAVSLWLSPTSQSVRRDQR